VVFVLATTDPQKVRDTIRSRTQHLAFHLLNERDLEAHVRWVAADAGIEITDAEVAAVLRQGAGSARDALSALELVASGGGLAVEVAPLDEVVEALVASDPGRALAAVAIVIQQGRDARGIAESVLAQLRDCFLSLMAPDLVQLPAARKEAVGELAHRLGAALAVRAMETIGDALVEMRHAPDPRVLLEVALVRLTSPPLSGDVPALAARVERLEQAVARLGTGPASGSTPRTVDPSTGRAVLGARARAQGDAPVGASRQVGTPSPVAAPASPIPDVAAGAAVPPTAQAGVVRPGDAPTARGDLAVLYETRVKPTLRGATKGVYLIAKARDHDGVLVLAFPSDGHARRARELVGDIERAMAAAAGAPVRVHVESDATPAVPVPAGESEPPLPEEEQVDMSELVDPPPEAHVSPLSRITAAFPGSQLVDGAE
jgi:DNA polymerase-3 subunit gamma/tau